MILTNYKKIWKYVWSYKDQGKNFQKYFRHNPKKTFKYVHDFIGSNFRITEMQSALGIIQLKELNQNIKKRNKYAEMISNILRSYKSVIIQEKDDGVLHAYYRYYFLINNKYLKKNLIEMKL